MNLTEFEEIKILAEENNPSACFWLGEYFSMLKQYAISTKWYLKGIELNDIRCYCTYILGRLLNEETETEKLIEELNKNVEKLKEYADDGDAGCQIVMSFILNYLGNQEMMVEYLNMAVESKISLAMYNLANYYKSIKDYENAFSLFSLSSDLELPSSMYEMSLNYERGFMVEKNTDRSFKLMLESANRDFYPAEEWVGMKYIDKELTIYDIDKAIMWLEKAASNGSTFAETKLKEIKKQ